MRSADEDIRTIHASSAASDHKQVQKLQSDFALKQAEVEATELEISDSAATIRTLHSRLEALKDADLAAEVVRTIHFGTCPACYAEIIEHDHDIGACHLCIAHAPAPSRST